jgi:hypothetical protein
MTTWLSALTKPSVTNEPPASGDQTRIDVAVIVTVLIALFLGFGIRDSAANASRSVELGKGLPTIKVPDNWITGKSADTLLEASDPSSPSVFKAEVVVITRPLAAGEDAVAARAAIGVQRTQNLEKYRELKSIPVTVNGKPGLLVTYSYIADPTREQGAVAPPVVVKAQDLIFPSGDNQALIVTVATDASTWDKEQNSIRIIQDSLGMKIQPVTVVTVEAQEGGK